MPAFASMTVKKCLSPKKGHNDTTIHVIPTKVGIPATTQGFFIPLWRGWPDLSGREMTKSGVIRYNSVPHLQGDSSFCLMLLPIFRPHGAFGCPCLRYFQWKEDKWLLSLSKHMATRLFHVIPLGTHPQPLPLSNGGEKKIQSKPACHSHESGNPRQNPAKQKTRCPLSRVWQW